jgi:predicted NBD/HSP70 family sugar kinase
MDRFGSQSRPADVSAGAVLGLIRSGRAQTRADIATLTGLARSTVVQRVDALLTAGFIHEAGEGPSTGGRPPILLEFNARAGIVLAADLGAIHCRLAVVDLAGDVLEERPEDLKIEDGPEHVLAWVQDRFAKLLAATGHTPRDVRGIGIGVPGPVEFATGRPVAPPIMPGWDGVAIPRYFTDRWSVPVLVDNDVNIMAVGEHRSRVWPDCDHMLYVKVATGIGCGIMAGGEIYRGAQGCAGDIGHIRLDRRDDAICRCGNTGCLEALASGPAVARQLTARGYETHNARDVVARVRSGNRDAIELVRTAGRLIGDVLAGAVNLLNPQRILIGGDLAAADKPLLAGIRESVYRQSPPLATRDLEISRSRLDDRAGIVGAAHMVIEEVLASDKIDAELAASIQPAP